jgi:hypothetical protein
LPYLATISATSGTCNSARTRPGRWPISAGREPRRRSPATPSLPSVACHGQHHRHLEYAFRHLQPGEHGLRA